MPATPVYLGYIVSAFKAYGGSKTKPHEYWENKIAPRVKSRIIDVLRGVDDGLTLVPPYKIADVKHFQSLPAIAQDAGTPLGWLQGAVSSGYIPEVANARKHFQAIALEVVKRLDQANRS